MTYKAYSIVEHNMVLM